MKQIPDWFTRQMGLSHSEFFRTLPAAVGKYDFEVNGTDIWVNLDSGRLNISLEPESVRSIASMRIARTNVKFCFEGVDPAERSAFISYFDKRYQRGGG